MTDLRTAAQQALEALKSVQDLRPNDETNAAITALRAALAEQLTCTWHQDGDSDSDLYATSCRNFFCVEDGTPEDNKMAWCCFCGKKLAQSLITEDEDD